MTFNESVQSVLREKYATFSGRASRSEFWWFYAFTVLVNMVTSFIDEVSGAGFVGAIVSLALLVPTLAVTVRRLHDSEKSAWWLLPLLTLPIIGVIGIVVAVFSAAMAAIEGGGAGTMALVFGAIGGLAILAGLGLWLFTMCAKSSPGANRYGPSPADASPAGPYSGHPGSGTPMVQHPNAYSGPTQYPAQYPAAPQQQYPTAPQAQQQYPHAYPQAEQPGQYPTQYPTAPQPPTSPQAQQYPTPQAQQQYPPQYPAAPQYPAGDDQPVWRPPTA